MMGDRDFFVGWRFATPPELARFAVAAGLGAAALLLLCALLLAPASSSHDGDVIGEVQYRGVLDMSPYPRLRIPAGEARLAPHDVLLSGEGKYGVDTAALAFAGRVVSARGLLVRRGDLEMLVVASEGLTADDAPPPISSPGVSLGRLRVAGEICDGKCTAGIMRPGEGLAHRACASLCIGGGVPPIFVTAVPAAGHVFFLLANVEGGPSPAMMKDFIGLGVVLEGDIVQSDDLPIFRVDWSKARAL